MSSIEFEEPQFSYRAIDISNAVTHNTPLLIRYRIIKDLKTANKVMIIASVILVATSIIILNFRPSATEKKYREDFSAYELERMLPDMVNNLPSKPK